jgi:hypothetical protein
MHSHLDRTGELVGTRLHVNEAPERTLRVSGLIGGRKAGIECSNHQ